MVDRRLEERREQSLPRLDRRLLRADCRARPSRGTPGAGGSLWRRRRRGLLDSRRWKILVALGICQVIGIVRVSSAFLRLISESIEPDTIDDELDPLGQPVELLEEADQPCRVTQAKSRAGRRSG